MKTFALAAVVALLATATFAADPAGWSRPGGYNDQVKGGSLSKPVDACTYPGYVDGDNNPNTPPTFTCNAPRAR